MGTITIQGSADQILVNPTGPTLRLQARPDTRTASDGSVVSGFGVVTSPAIGFKNGDVGKICVINDANNINAFGGFITSVSGNTANVSGASSSTISFGTVVVGTDNCSNIQEACNAIAAVGGTVELEAGPYLVGPPGITVPGGVTLQGQGIDYGIVQIPSARGTVLMAGDGSMASVVQLGTDATSFLPGQTCPRLINIAVDGMNLAGRAVRTVSRRSRVIGCQIWRGRIGAILLDGQNSNLLGCIVGQDNNGNVVTVNNVDCKVKDNEIRQNGVGAGIFVGSSATIIQSNFIFQGINGVISSSLPGNCIFASYTPGNQSSLVISGNYLNGAYGSTIKVATSGTNTMRSVLITGNLDAQNSAGYPDGLFDFVEFVPANTSVIRGVIVDGNVGSTASAAAQYRSIANMTGAGTVEKCSVTNNAFTFCAAIFGAGFVPDSGTTGNSIT